MFKKINQWKEVINKGKKDSSIEKTNGKIVENFEEKNKNYLSN